MQYLLQIYSGDSMDAYARLPEDEKEAVMGEYFAISGMRGITGGAQLQPPTTATTVRVEDGGTLTTDGPFAATKEALGGYYMFEADDLDGRSRSRRGSPPRAWAGRSRCVRWWRADRAGLPPGVGASA